MAVVVVVGMAQNPHVKNVRNALKEAKIEFTYLEYGSYFSEWKKRLAIKMWSGWPTFPQVFVRGSLIGGSNINSGEIFSNSDMGAVKIGHDVQGGSGEESGFIQSLIV